MGYMANFHKHYAEFSKEATKKKKNLKKHKKIKRKMAAKSRARNRKHKNISSKNDDYWPVRPFDPFTCPSGPAYIMKDIPTFIKEIGLPKKI